jgi:serine/threonine-protein kinase
VETVRFEPADGLPGNWDESAGASGPRLSSATSEALDPEFPTSGLVLEGRYRLIYRLACGNMSSVWFAEHLVLAAPVAIKFMQPGVDADADARGRFLREARIASAVRNPHVVQILDFGVEQDTPYIVMEYLRGESLARRLRRLGRLSPAETASVLAPLAQALRRAHELGVVHRDLKPENIFITSDGERELTKLLDFGVAKVGQKGFGVSVARDTAEGEIVGTPHYMSPEQARGARSVDHRTDVWALGVIAFECLVGFPPFAGDGLGGLLMAICSRPLPVPSEFGSVPAGFDTWFARACHRLPELRFPTLAEAARQLQRVCESGASTGLRRTARAARRARRAAVQAWSRSIGARAPRLSVRWLAVMAVLSLLGGVATGAARRSREAPRPTGRSAVPASARTMPVSSPPRPGGEPRARAASSLERREGSP